MVEQNTVEKEVGRATDAEKKTCIDKLQAMFMLNHCDKKFEGVLTELTKAVDVKRDEFPESPVGVYDLLLRRHKAMVQENKRLQYRGNEGRGGGGRYSGGRGGHDGRTHQFIQQGNEGRGDEGRGGRGNRSRIPTGCRVIPGTDDLVYNVQCNGWDE